MSFSSSQDLLYTLISSPRIDSSLYPYRVYTLLKECGFQPDSIQYTHVAGSKGKGSLSRTAFRLLALENINAGLFTSPHIFHMTERIETAKGIISEENFISLVDEFYPLFLEKKLHFFEALLFMALVHFLREGCTHVILEVGVGGRYDPTNFCMPSLVLMGHISMEHREFLGGTLESIAKDKAGVLKEGVLALSVDQTPSIKDIFLQEKADINFFNELISLKNVKKTKWGTIFDADFCLKGKEIHLKDIFLHRIGNGALINFCLAALGIFALFPQLKTESVIKAAQEVIPFRLQLMGTSLLVDTAHNGQSFFNLCQALDEWLGWKEINFYISLMEGKEYEDIASVLKDYQHLWKKIFIFEFPVQGARRSNGKEFFRHLQGLPAEYLGTLPPNYKYEKNTTAVWAGSFYSIDYLLKILKQNKNMLL